MTTQTATALSTVYVVWGSTYLAIRVMVESLPPLLAAGARFLLAGAALAGVVFLRGGRERLLVRSPELAGAAAVGCLVLFGGIGLVTVAEQHVASGIAALVIASVPLWVLLLRALNAERIPRASGVASLVGFAGVALLFAPGQDSGRAPADWLLVLIGAAAMTAVGAWYAHRWPLPRDAYVSTALQLLTAGSVTFALALVLGEGGDLVRTHVSPRSLVAFLYLVVFGSLVAYTAFAWLLQHAPPALVATYAYVNPVVALVLGAAMLGERLTAPILLSAVVVVGSVGVVVRAERPTRG